MLQGHERALTQVKYNREGDLIFSASKDTKPNVWYSLNGERLGTFNGHLGAIWCIDVDWTSTKFLSGSADTTLRLWDTETGLQVGKVDAKSSVRTCAFSYSSNMAFYTTDATMGNACEIFVVDVRCSDDFVSDPILRMLTPGAKVTSAFWGPLDQTIVTGHEDGTITRWDVNTGKVIDSVKEHKGPINDIQKSKNGTMFVSASKDTTARLFDTDDLSALKVYQTERPVNSAAISPLYDHVVVGGGQEAMDVTTTSARAGKFDARFFHLVFEEEFARVKGHFGPINTIAFHPDGKSFASGGEDGFVRVNTFDQSYFDYKFDY